MEAALLLQLCGSRVCQAWQQAPMSLLACAHSFVSAEVNCVSEENVQNVDDFRGERIQMVPHTEENQ